MKTDGAGYVSRPPLTRMTGISCAAYALVARLAHEAQQHQEQVDEVQIERERSHDRTALDGRYVTRHVVVDILQALRVIGREPGKYQHPHRRNRLTRAAITIPINPMNKKVPKPLKSRLVV